MAIQYKHTRHAQFFDPDKGLTEPEHADSCDINKMVRSAMRGQQVRGSLTGSYGQDDLTIDAIQHRINKQKVTEELLRASQEAELTEEQVKSIPEGVKKAFQFKIKKAVKNDNSNDDQKPANDVKSQADQPSENSVPSKKL